MAAGASYQFRLLFIVLLANVIAIFLQSLCIKLGTVSGMDLAQMCREHLPWWLNIFLYVLAEGAVSSYLLFGICSGIKLTCVDYCYGYC